MVFLLAYFRSDIYAAQSYILIDQYSIHIEQYYKIGDNKWVFSEYADPPEASLNLASVPYQILLADIYDKVDFNVVEE